MRFIDPTEYITEVSKEAQASALPHLVPIYNGRDDQVGTAFLTMWHGKQLLVTAAHCLFGATFTEKAEDKQIFADGALKPLGQVTRSEVAFTKEMDVAIAHVDGFEPRRVLPYTALQIGLPAPERVSIVGYLARDFHRSGADTILRPKPFCYSGTKVELGPQLVGVRYNKRAVTTKNGQLELAPIPRGVSGAPMLNTAALLLNQVRVCGVFTDERMSDAHVFGTHADVLPPLMQTLIEP
ncbi:hypothetical protein [Mesorhizobium sp. M0019]|uniref:trypsin-like peptidase domain-containing protein n=1 Tax=Mesorhizobium sp. M0019 TaxID=2956845 RepID=UPI0033396BFE